MPQVPQVQGRSVETSALPGVSQSIGGASPAAFGGIQAEQTQQVGQALQGAAKLAGGVYEMQQKAIEEADRMRVDDAVNQLLPTEAELQGSYLSRKGAAAFNAQGGKSITDEAGESYQKTTDALSQQLGNERQRTLFKQQADRRRAMFVAGIQRHESEQLTAYGIDVQQAKTERGVQDVGLYYNDPQRVAESAQTIRESVAEWGRMRGEPPETVQAKTIEALSKAHKGAIDQMLTGGKSQDVMAYVERHKADMTPDLLAYSGGKVQMVTAETIEKQILNSEQSGDKATVQSLLSVLSTDDKTKRPNISDSQSNVLQGRAQAALRRMEQAERVAVDRREATARAQMNDLEKQILSGGMIDPTRFTEAEAAISGTSYAERYNVMTRNYVAIQDFKSRPMPEQAAALRQLEAQLSNKATKNPAELQQILGVYRSVYAEGAKQAKENPLGYIGGLTGQAAPPLDMAALNRPDGLQAVAAQLSERFRLLDAVARRDGAMVGGSPFYPEELEVFKRSVAGMDNGQKLQSLAVLARASGGGARYDAALKRIGADDPAFRLAGLAQAAGLKTTYGANVADLVLAGDKIRRENTYPLPPDAAIDRALNTYIDGAVPIGSEAHSMYVQMTRMVYAGMAARDRVQYDKDMPIDPDGVMSGDDPIMDAAVRVVTGGVTEHAGSKIIRPYAMPESNFQAALTTSLQRLSQIHGVDLADIDDMPLVPIVGAKAGMYHISDGRGGIQRSPKNGQPMIVAVQ